MKLCLILNNRFEPSSRPPPGPLAQPGPSPSRRTARHVWELEPHVVLLATGLLLERDQVAELLGAGAGREPCLAGEDELRSRLAAACARPGPIARDVEKALDARSSDHADLVARQPMIHIADWWSPRRDRAALEELAGLLWRLASDPSPFLVPLTSRVASHLLARTLVAARATRIGARRQPVAAHRLAAGADPG